MRRIYLALPCILFLTTHTSYAQEVDWDKFEVGIDLLWMIKKNNVPPSFFIKKLDLKQRKNDFGFVRRGYRLRIGGNYQQPDEKTQIIGYSALRQSSYSFIFRPGYEWHRRIKSLDVFYGFDIHASVYGRKYDNSIVTLTDDNGGVYSVLYTQKNRELQIGLSPILGTTIKIYKNISLTLESTIDFYYTDGVSLFEGNSNFEDIKVTANGFGVNMYPLYTLNASFSF